MRDIVPELKYCPVCNDEYRAEIVMCAGCEVELMTGEQYLEMKSGRLRERENRSMELSVDDELVAIRSGSLIDMKQLRSLLAKEMIPSLLVSEDGGCAKGCCGSNFVLQVRLQDGQEALAVLADEFKRSTSLESHDLSNADAVFDVKAENITCPACGHSFAPTTTTCPDCGLCFG